MKRLFFTLNFILFIFCCFGQTWQPLTYDSLKSGLETNPLKGFATIFNPDPTSTFPATVQGKLFGLDEVMFGPNTFDWQVIDDFLDDMSEQGKHSYLQVNIDPAFGNTHLPPYLFPLVDTFFYDDPNPVSPVDDLCPDWNDPDLIDAMVTFIDSFGMRYDNDDRVYMIHLGLYGMWGEWHIGDVALVRPEFDMTEDNKALIANAYADAFPNTLLLARFPENMPIPQDYGYSDGLFFTESISDVNNFFFHNTLKINNADLNWKHVPIGGEITPEIQSELWDNWPNTIGQDVLQSFDSIRPSFLFSHHHFTDQIVENTAEWDNSIRAIREMGYSLFIDSVRFSAANGMPVIEANILNRGIAPFYGDWEIEFSAIDVNNQVINLGTSTWALHLIQPDTEINYRSFHSNVFLPDGDYTLLLKVKNPIEAYTISDAPEFTFANESQNQDLQGAITLGDFSIINGTNGIVPIPVTSISLNHSVDTLLEGESLHLMESILPTDATNQTITWTSSRPRSLSVDENGFVTTGNAFGTSTISAYTQDGNFVASCDIVFAPVYVNIPAIIEAEDFIAMQGVQNNICCGGIEILEFIDNNDWMDYGISVSDTGIFVVDFRVSSDNANGMITLLAENQDTLTTLHVDNATYWQDYQIKTASPFILNKGEHIVRLFATHGGFNIDLIEFKQLPNSFTFIGTMDDKFENIDNWLSGSAPPDDYPGKIVIAADCVISATYPLTINENTQLIINSGVLLRVQ